MAVGRRDARDIDILLAEALTDFGVRRCLTVSGTAYYANGEAFAATRGRDLYLRLDGRDEDDLRAETGGHESALERDSLGLLKVPQTVCCDPDRTWPLVVRAFERTLPDRDEAREAVTGK